MICVLSLIGFGYFIGDTGLVLYRACTYECGEVYMTIKIPAELRCPEVLGDA